jgi:L-cystine uptake protein TcyP (sodium:dicarboxylate symporter family)
MFVLLADCPLATAYSVKLAVLAAGVEGLYAIMLQMIMLVIALLPLLVYTVVCPVVSADDVNAIMCSLQ